MQKGRLLSLVGLVILASILGATLGRGRVALADGVVGKDAVWDPYPGLDLHMALEEYYTYSGPSISYHYRYWEESRQYAGGPFVAIYEIAFQYVRAWDCGSLYFNDAAALYYNYQIIDYAPSTTYHAYNCGPQADEYGLFYQPKQVA